MCNLESVIDFFQCNFEAVVDFQCNVAVVLQTAAAVILKPCREVSQSQTISF